MIAKLSQLWLIALLFAVTAAIGHWQRSRLYYPHVVAEAPGGLSLTFLYHAVGDRSACLNASVSIVNPLRSNCPDCRIVRQDCARELSSEQRAMLSEAPLPFPVARLPNGVVAYHAVDAAAGLFACTESERQAIPNGPFGRVYCALPNTVRTLPQSQRDAITAAQLAFEVLFILIGVTSVAVIAVLLYGATLRHAGQATRSHRTWVCKFTLAGVDTVVLLATFALLVLPSQEEAGRWTLVERKAVIAHVTITLLTIGWFWFLLEHYARRRPFWDELREIFRVLFAMFIVASATVFFVELHTARTAHMLVWALSFVLVPTGRAAAKQVLNLFGFWQRPAIIIGCGVNARDAYDAIRSDDSLGYRVVGFISTRGLDTPDQTTPAVGFLELPVIECTQDLEHTLAAMAHPHIVVALESLNDAAAQALVQRLAMRRVNIDIIPAIRGLPLFGMRLSHFFSHEVLFLTLQNNLARLVTRAIKRAIDVLGAFVLLVFLGPAMLLIGLYIRRDGGPALYGDQRIARDGGEFICLKFRTMVMNADKMLANLLDADPALRVEYEATFKLKTDPRITRIGAFLRRTSLDELPQLLNVLKGDMSLVGPRPMLPDERPKYGEHIAYYFQVRPGITGLWQISGRNDVDYSQRMYYVAWYVKNWSLWYDTVILLKTVGVVLRKSGAY